MMQAWLPIRNKILLYISKKQFLIRLQWNYRYNNGNVFDWCCLEYWLVTKKPNHSFTLFTFLS